jgi:hypothetical protein
MMIDVGDDEAPHICSAVEVGTMRLERRVGTRSAWVISPMTVKAMPSMNMDAYRRSN